MDTPVFHTYYALALIVAVTVAVGFARSVKPRGSENDSEQRRRVRFQLEHDALTGLGNRTQLRRVLRAHIAAGAPFAFAYLDLDGFRTINEIVGNAVADDVLVEIASSLAGVDERDVVARTSGDRFAVIVRGVDSIAEANARLIRYADLFRTPVPTGDRAGTRKLAVSGSFGAARFPADGTTAEDLQRAADVALDAAKARGGSRIVFFDASMTARMERYYVQSIELTDAIDGGALALFYQPTFSLATRRITGAEALVRWNHPARGQLLPDEFIRFADRDGLIGRLSRWVFDRLVADVSRFRNLPEGFCCSFNLAAADLDDLALLGEVERCLRSRSDLAAHIAVELAETAAIANPGSSAYVLRRFHELGVRVAIDAFGTGYSSLSYLKRLPVDTIKIDRSSVTGLPHDEQDAALAELLLGIARRFGFASVAVGIESETQLAWLRDHGCHDGQGFLVAKALPFDAFSALVSAQPALR